MSRCKRFYDCVSKFYFTALFVWVTQWTTRVHQTAFWKILVPAPKKGHRGAFTMIQEVNDTEALSASLLPPHLLTLPHVQAYCSTLQSAASNVCLCSPLPWPLSHATRTATLYDIFSWIKEPLNSAFYEAESLSSKLLYVSVWMHSTLQYICILRHFIQWDCTGFIENRRGSLPSHRERSYFPAIQ